MQGDSTPHPWLQPLFRTLTRPQRQNLLALVVAVQLARTLLLRQLALFLLLGITPARCYRRLQRVLSWEQEKTWKPLSRLWVRAVLRCFAPGRGRVPVLVDWTLHRDRCRSLWAMLPVGGRAVPLAFWLAGSELGGPGAQRKFEDRAFQELQQWLPKGRPVVLIGDRGFRGADRIRFLRKLGWNFVLRVTGDTMARLPQGRGKAGAWARLEAQQPAVGKRGQYAGVELGKTDPVRVSLFAVRQALLAPKRVRNHKGKPTGEMVTETPWFLVTDLPLTVDAAAVYAWRRQIEEPFRDYKALFGMEQERTREPTQRLVALRWALRVGRALDLGPETTPPPPAGTSSPAGGCRAQVPAWPPLRVGSAAAQAEKPQYPSESATREGRHRFVLQLVLGQLPFQAELRALYAKSLRMRERPQVRERRRAEPAKRRRERRAGCNASP